MWTPAEAVNELIEMIDYENVKGTDTFHPDEIKITKMTDSFGNETWKVAAYQTRGPVVLIYKIAVYCNDLSMEFDGS